MLHNERSTDAELEGRRGLLHQNMHQKATTTSGTSPCRGGWLCDEGERRPTNLDFQARSATF